MKRSVAFSLVTMTIALISLGNRPIRASEQETILNHPPPTEFSLPAAPEGGKFLVVEQNGMVACRETTAQNVDAPQRDPSIPLHPISHTNLSVLRDAGQGLKIVLRATQQLENFPKAKAAFLKSAAIWEDKIQTPITIVIDVDFGPTFFGQKWPPSSLGNSNAQELSNANVYDTVRGKLLAAATDDQQLAIYNALPIGSIPTDLGSTTAMTGPSATARALGLLDPVADPDMREKNLGNPPEVAFNSNFAFDFDPTDGTDSGKIDFEAVAVHEIGHVLGFISKTGARELDSKAPIAPTEWDLFRLTSSTPQTQFSSALRVLSSGGTPMFTVSEVELPLSTGRPDGSGGDRFQASHWKNDDLIGGRYIGVMEVGLPFGKHQVMTACDLLAIRLMGYRLNAGIEIVPELAGLSGEMRDDVLGLTALVINIGSASVEGQVKVLDDSGNVLAEYRLAPFDLDKLMITSSELKVPGIDRLRAATQASLTLLDSSGNRSTALTTGISNGDPGAPTLLSLSFDGSVLRIRGKRLSGATSLEVNGAAVPIPNVIVKGAGKKAMVEATAGSLQLSGGPNRVRVITNGLRSNALILSL